MSTRLSQHFYLEEFLQSQTAARLGIKLELPAPMRPTLQRLVDRVLEPLRVALGSPVHVSSGYRDAVVNRLVGGAYNSAHMTARAADIIAPGMTARQLAVFIKGMDLPDMHKCILEFGQWVHVSIAKDNEAPLRQYMNAARVNGSTVYTLGYGE
jgi:zinc D-Ala-D-Ala carboxypeptidase